KWGEYISKGSNKIAKMGIWMGFQFGLRLGEIIHLRIQDIDFDKQEIYIRPHRKGKNQRAWNPKYNRERQVPFTKDQAAIFKRWIHEVRPELNHSYLLWTPTSKQPLHPRNFQRWCMKANLHAHVLRYSFATHYYNQTKDVKLISELLGHSSVSTTSEYLCLSQQKVMEKARAAFASS
ncbi:MAG: tyrosine-type recombinase/integrase, partial [Candidatus Hodarchaeales archaeon]